MLFTVHGLTPAWAEVIWLLHNGGPRTQRELSQVLKCTPRNVTGRVEALQTAGFVARSAHPTDRRATIVSLTEQRPPRFLCDLGRLRGGCRRGCGGAAAGGVGVIRGWR